MSRRTDRAAVIGVGAAACAACCAGPVLGLLALIGVGTVVGVALFGIGALLAGALAAGVVVRRRRRPARADARAAGPVPVELTSRRPRP